MRVRSLLGAAGGFGLLAASLLTNSTARADISVFGNSRSIAMGGAGLALVDRKERSTLENPAALALFDRKTAIGWPGFSLHASGIPIGDAFSHIFGSVKNDAVSLARDFGQRDFNFGASLNWGVRLGHLDPEVTGIGLVRGTPNAALRTWASTANGDVTKLTGNERGDLIGAAIYAVPNIGFAERVSPAGSPIRIEAGVRVKLERAVYSHYIVNADNIKNNTAPTPAPELTAGGANRTTLTKDSIGVDFGLLGHPRMHNGWSGALVVTNLIVPAFQFNGTDANGNPTRYDLQPRSVSLGSAWEGGRLVAAADVVDLTRAYANVQGRIGLEYTTRKVSYRAGYASSRGFTVGFGFRNFDFAYGPHVPLGISEFLRF